MCPTLLIDLEPDSLSRAVPPGWLVGADIVERQRLLIYRSEPWNARRDGDGRDRIVLWRNDSMRHGTVVRGGGGVGWTVERRKCAMI